MHNKYWLILFLIVSTSSYSMTPGLSVAAKAAQTGLAANVATSSAATATVSQRFHQAIQQIAQNNAASATALKSASQGSLNTFLDANSPLFKEFCELHTAGKISVLKEKLAQLKEAVAANPMRSMLYEKKQIATLEFLLKQEVSTTTLSQVIDTAKKVVNSKPIAFAARFIIPWQYQLIYKVAAHSYEKLFQDVATTQIKNVSEQKTINQGQSSYLQFNDPLYHQYVALQMSGHKKQLQEILSEHRKAIKAQPFAPMQYKKMQVATLEKLLQQPITDTMESIAHSELPQAEYAYQTMKKQCENGEYLKEELEAARMVLQAHPEYQANLQQPSSIIENQELNQSISQVPAVKLDSSQLPEQIPFYHELASLQQDHGTYTTKRFEDRDAAVSEIENGIIHYSPQNYRINNAAAQLIQEAGSDIALYKSCYGNQLQHTIHQECIDIVEQAAALPSTSPLYQYKNELAQCAGVAAQYNRVGLISRAQTITNFCWALLQYAKAIVTGIVQGVIESLRNPSNILKIKLPSLSVLRASVEMQKALAQKIPDMDIHVDHKDQYTVAFNDSQKMTFSKAQIGKLTQYMPAEVQTAVKANDLVSLGCYLHEHNITPQFINNLQNDLDPNSYNNLLENHKTISQQHSVLENRPQVIHTPKTIEFPNDVMMRVRGYHNKHLLPKTKIDHFAMQQKDELIQLQRKGMRDELISKITEYEKNGLTKLAAFAYQLATQEITATLDAIAHSDLRTSLALVEQIKTTYEPIENILNNPSVDPLVKAHVHHEKLSKKGNYDLYKVAGEVLQSRADYQRFVHYKNHPEELLSARETLTLQECGLILEHLLQLPESQLSQLASTIQKQQASYDLIQERQNPLFQKEVRINFGSEAIAHFTETEIPLYEELIPICQEHGFNTQRYEKRLQAYQETIQAGLAQYAVQSYKLSSAVKELVTKTGQETLYTSCYGSPLQQAVHQECIATIEQISALPENSPLYVHKEALLECTHAACEYNQLGLTHKATAITDFCWILFDYGQAMAEGVVSGLMGAVTDMIEHPMQTAMMAVVGEYVLAYQLSKVLYDVGRIGITTYFDSIEGAKQWHEYIAPVNKLIDACANNQIGMRDVIKGATHFAVEWKTQAKLLNGLNKLYTGAKNQAVAYAEKFPSSSPDQYVTTPEGLLVKSAHKIDNPEVMKESLLQKMSSEQKVISSNTSGALKPLGLGSTGRTIAKSLTEKLAMQEIISNPTLGKAIRIKKGMTDARWPQENGWVKMAWQNADVEIHYVAQWKDNILIAVDDFKFIDH